MSDERAWKAVAGRERAFDGLLVYGVLTTRVYCRPSCSARRPARAHVRFFDTPAAARRAGFRPCKRCLPDGRDPRGEVIARACEYLERHLDERVTLARLSDAVGMSAGHLQRTFKARLGVSPAQHTRALRAQRLRAALREPGGTVARAAFDAGFGSTSAMYEAASAHLGMSPATYSAGGRGAEVRYAVARCPLGFVLVARTERGICLVTIAGSAREAEATLRAELPHATIARAPDPGLRSLCREIGARASDGEGAPQPALDIAGTGFQWAVWRALVAIPPGATASYAEVARRIGHPAATRAVANACAANPVALLVPCHRVVRSDGTLGGYRWGPERKRALLDAERAHARR